MKTKFNTAIKAGLFAAAMACAGASQAVDVIYTVSRDTSSLTQSGANIFQSGAVSFGQANQIVIPAWNANASGSASLLAFCLQPSTGILDNAQYSASGYAASEAVRKLYESSYSKVGTVGHLDAKAEESFQLALWELTNDDGDLFAGTGAQHFSTAQNTTVMSQVVYGAKQMLTDAAAYNLNAQPAVYSFTQLTSQGSQQLLTVSAVPEAGAWAMLLVGLGLLGVVSRRKNSEDDKFV